MKILAYMILMFPLMILLMFIADFYEEILLFLFSMAALSVVIWAIYEVTH